MRLAGSFSIFPPAFSTPPPAPSFVFPRSGCSSMTLRLLFRLSGSLSIFPLAFLLPPTGCSSLPPPLVSHPAGCFSIFPGAVPCPHLLCRLPGYFSIFPPGSPSPLPLSPAVCFFAFPVPPFPCTTTSCFSIFVATFLAFLPDFSPSLTQLHTLAAVPSFSQLPRSLSSPPPPQATFLSTQLLFHLFCLLLYLHHFSGCSFTPLLLFHLSSYFHIFLAVLPPTPTVAFPSFWVLFHPPNCSSMPPATFPILPSICALVKSPVASSHSLPPPCLPLSPTDCPIASGKGFLSPLPRCTLVVTTPPQVSPQLHPLHLSCIPVFNLTTFYHHILHLALGPELISAD